MRAIGRNRAKASIHNMMREWQEGEESNEGRKKKRRDAETDEANGERKDDKERRGERKTMCV